MSRWKILIEIPLYFFVAFLILDLAATAMHYFQLLDPKEQQLLKEGKTFWTWDRERGSHSIHYLEKGEGSKHVILIHGFRANTYTWKALLEPLTEAGFHVWALDLLGFGFSDKPNTNYNIELFLEQIEAFMAHKKIPHAHFIGSSMGGGLSLWTALNMPNNVDSLTLIDALGYPLDLPLYLSIGKHFNQLWTPFLSETMVRKGIEDLVFHKDSIKDEQVEAYSLPYRFPGGAEAALYTLRSFDNQKLHDIHPRYAKEIKCPVLLIWGDNDTLIPLPHYDQFCNDFPHAHKHLIRNCGHLPHEEKPEEVRNIILFFLNTMSH